MAEEKKEEAKKKPAEEAPEEAPQPKADKPKHIKVTQMSLEQVEEALGICDKNMGGYNSRYAQALLARRDFLNRYQATAQKKAA